MSRKVGRAGVVVVALAVARWAGAQAPSPKPAATPPSGPDAPPAAVAVVGQMRIGRDELDQQMQQALQLYRDRNRTSIDPQLEPVVRRQVLENLIRQRLLALDARRRGVTVSDAEADAQLRLDPAFQQGGVFNEAKYLAIRGANPDGYARALAATRDALAARKAGERMDRETRPDDAAIRVQLEREMARVTIEYLCLRARDFDGSYREPREEEIQPYLAANAERYRRPEEASLSVVLVNRPALTDSAGGTDAGYRAWEDRMRARADSALAAVWSGAKVEELALRFGGMRKKISLRRDRLPDFWRGGPREVAAVLSAAPGTLLPEPVRAAPGWALVRVDAVSPSHIAPIREVAREIRRELRSAARRRAENRLLEAIHAEVRDSLRGDGYRVRYAVADTASFSPGEPTASDLDRFYRAHLADYSSYDKVAGAVVETPLVQVRDELRRRWIRDRRRELARVAAERLRETWSRGRRDASLEAAMTLVREIGPVPAGGMADSGAVGAALEQILAGRVGRTGVATTTLDVGYLVGDVREVVHDYIPTLDQARALLAPRAEALRSSEELAEARRLFDEDSSVFRSRALVRFSRLVIEPPPPMNVELSRDEVERYYRAHLNEYSVEELVRVRHILISPSGSGAAADANARARAEEILGRVRAGEDFVKLAAEFSDDPATRLGGGDVGVFRRGQMRVGFERAAFAMRPGDITGPVRTEVGYHILECLEYVPPVIHPIVEVYANVAHACASQKAQRIATERADSLFRTLKSVAQAKAVAARVHLDVMPTEHEVGLLGRFDDTLLPYIKKIETLEPGVLYPGTQLYEGLGQVISWVDTVLPPRPLGWEEARNLALDRYRLARVRRAILAKKAELDSLLAAGWSFDSLTTLWGGPERLAEASMGSELRGMGGRGLLDSLVFGRARDPVLETGKVSAWIEFPGGYAMLRVNERVAPDPDDLARHLELRHQLVLWRNLNTYFDRLKARYPVEILDGELRATALPEPTES